jgi:hypothetical protein
VPAPRFRDFATAGPDVFLPHPELHDFVMWRFEPVTSLIQEIREAAAMQTRVYLIDLKDGWLSGCDLGAATQACDGAILCGYDMSVGQVGDLLARRAGTVGTERFLGTGFRLFYPEMTRAEDLVARAEAAAKAGAQSINFYNYGLVPGARLDWARQAIGAASGA